MRRSLFATLLLTSLYQVATAADNTRPFLAWSPQSLNRGLQADSAIVSSKDLVSGMSKLADCSHKVVLFVDESELHASDLKQGHSGLKREMTDAKYSTQIAFVHGSLDLEDLAQKQADKCHATLIKAAPEESITLTQDPAVVYLQLPTDSSTQHDRILEKTLSTIKQQAKDDYLVLYSSSKSKDPLTRRRLDTRQDPNEPGQPTPSTQPSGVFHHYTFFSQGIYMGLLILFLVVPIILIGISWNLSIKAPVRFEAKPKTQ